MKFVTGIQTHPVLSYFSMAFGITWLGILLIVLPTGLPGHGDNIPRLLPLAFLAMIAGPATSCLVLTGIAHGQEGYRKLIARLFHVRVDPRWYAIVLITPVLLTVILGLLSLFSPTGAAVRLIEVLHRMQSAVGGGEDAPLCWVWERQESPRPEPQPRPNGPPGTTPWGVVTLPVERRYWRHALECAMQRSCSHLEVHTGQHRRDVRFGGQRVLEPRTCRFSRSSS